MWELLQNLMSIKDYILKSDFKEQTNLAKTFECAMNLAFTKKTNQQELVKRFQVEFSKQETDKLNLFPVRSLGTFC